MQELIERIRAHGNLGPVYGVLEFEEGHEAVKEHVIAIGPAGVYISEFDPPKPDAGWLIAYERFGRDFFFDEEEAKKKAAELNGRAAAAK